MTERWRSSDIGLMAGAMIALALGWSVVVRTQGATDVDWRNYSGTTANLKYAPLDQIN